MIEYPFIYWSGKQDKVKIHLSVNGGKSFYLLIEANVGSQEPSNAKIVWEKEI